MSKYCSFEALGGIFWKKWRKWTPSKIEKWGSPNCHFSLGSFFQKIQVSRGIGCNAKIFKIHFLELSYKLVFKNMHHLWAIYFFVNPFMDTVCVFSGHCLVTFFKHICFMIFLTWPIDDTTKASLDFNYVKPCSYLFQL